MLPIVYLVFGPCSCVTAHMSCSMLCACHAGPDCNNKHTRNQSLFDAAAAAAAAAAADDDDDDDDDER